MTSSCKLANSCCSDLGQSWCKPVDDGLFTELRSPAEPKPALSQRELLDRHLDAVCAQFSASTPLKLFLLYAKDADIAEASRNYQLMAKLNNHHLTLCHLEYQADSDVTLTTRHICQSHHYQPRYWTSHFITGDLLKHAESPALARLLQLELQPTTAILALGKLSTPIQTFPPLAWYNLPSDTAFPPDCTLDVLCFVLADAYFEAIHPLQACTVLPRIPERGRPEHLLLILREAMLSQPVSAVVQCQGAFGVLELSQAAVR